MQQSLNTLRIELPGAIDLEPGQSLTFQYQRQGEPEQGFVLRLESGFVAFANRCPHWDIELDLGDGRFYDPRIQRIYCKNHGATFLPSDGMCDAGPCQGRTLEAFRISVEGRVLVVEIE